MIKVNKTGISWTDYTSSPIKPVGKGWMCAKVSEGCTNCYAEALNMRYGNRQAFNSVNLKNTAFRIDENEIKRLVKAPAGSKVFLQDMTDIFNESIPFEFVDRVMDVAAQRPDVTFQILTKRTERAMDYLERSKRFIPLPENVWFGASVERAKHKYRIADLNHGISAAVKFVSFEPLLGDIGVVPFSFIDWIIIGGESGPQHRPMKIEWARNLIRQAKEQGVAVWMKQLGGIRPGGELEDFPEDLRIREFPEYEECE